MLGARSAPVNDKNPRNQASKPVLFKRYTDDASAFISEKNGFDNRVGKWPNVAEM
jgi:hypothetical protein